MPKKKSPKKPLRKKSRKVALKVREKVTAYLLGAFGLITGLAWDDAMKALINALYPLEKNSLVAKFVYAGILTVVVVIVTIVFVKFSKQKEEEHS